MAKQFHVNLGFTADTKQAQAQIANLQRQLTSLINSPVNIGTDLTSEITKATHAAAELKVHLKNATNVDTGALDFSKLTESIKKSGKNLEWYGEQIYSLGPKGRETFMSLADSIATAEVPLKRSNVLLTNFFTTLKNTARWQLSSSLLHGLQSGVQKAYHYAEDLNESLNNIRIVTGQNIDQMAKFAKEANLAAKTLSTTTTEYTNASLIYYQQGLNTQQVKERTDLTIKMANVARVSAETASDQLTAIWNNFDNGTKSLEYYVDVMTALGAKTASSTDEIAGGLEKFAGIANTIGLSYEYATAAITTLTSNTRQSEEEVGTSLKTIFARIQGLNLGETLEDGVDLNKYSKALKTVGIDILDQYDNLKDMDVILDELGNKWSNISKAQQTALAQTVAGTRQYNQLVSLMDNWNKGDEDSFVTNVATARGASGSLQEQADIYAESWEAARDRVTAAAEKMYAMLLDDETFIEITDLFANLVDLAGDFTQSIGGLGGVIHGLGAIATKVFSNQIAQGLRDMTYRMKMSTEAGRQMVQNEKTSLMQKFSDIMTQDEASGIANATAQKVYKEQLQLQKEILANADRITEEERAQYQILLEQTKEYSKQAIATSQQIEAAQNRRSALIDSAKYIAQGAKNEDFAQNTDMIQRRLHEISELGDLMGQFDEDLMKLRTTTNALTEKDLNPLLEKLAALRKGSLKTSISSNTFNELEEVIRTLNGVTISAKDGAPQIEAFVDSLRGIEATKINEVLGLTGWDEKDARFAKLYNYLLNISAESAEIGGLTKRLRVNTKNVETTVAATTKSVREAKGATKDWANHMTSVVSGLMSAGSFVSSVKGLVDTLKAPDTSGWEKFGAILTSLSMAAGSLGNTLHGLGSAIDLVKSLSDTENKVKLKSILLSWAEAKASKGVQEAKEEEAESRVENTVAAKIENQSRMDSELAEAMKKFDPTKPISHSNPKPFLNKNKNAIRWFAGDKDADGNFLAWNPKEKKAYKNTTISVKEYGEELGLITPDKQSVDGDWSKILSTIGSQIGPIMAVAGAVAVVAGAITLAVAQYQKWDIKAEKAANAASMLADKANEVQDSFNEFSNTLNSYQNARKSIDELTRGTVEYNEALVNANTEAMKLIEQYEELAGQYTINNGVITIDEDALIEAQNNQLRELQNAQAQASLANIGAREAKAKASNVDLARDMNGGGAAAGNAAVMTGVGALAGVLLGIGAAITPYIAIPIAAAIAASGSIAAGVIGSASKEELEAIDKLGEAYTKELTAEQRERLWTLDDDALRQELMRLTGASEEVAAAMVEERKALAENTKALHATLKQNQTDWINAFIAKASENEDFANSDFQTAIAYLAQQQAEKANEDATKEIENMSAHELAQAYITEVLGDTITKSGHRETGSQYRIRQINGGDVMLEEWKDGKWVDMSQGDNLSKDSMRKQLLESRSIEAQTENLNNLTNTINQSAKLLQEAGLNTEKDIPLIDNILKQYNDILSSGIDATGMNYAVLERLDDKAIADSELQAYVKKVQQAAFDNLGKFGQSILKESWYLALSDSDKELFWTIDIDQYSSLENVEAAWEALQLWTENHQLTTTIGIADELKSLLSKEKKSSEDWKKIKEKYDEFDVAGKKSFEDFMKMSQQEQLKYIKTIEQGSISGSILTNKTAVEKQEVELTKAIDDAKKSQEKLDTYNQQIQKRDRLTKKAEQLRTQNALDQYSTDVIINEYLATGDAAGWLSGESVFGLLTDQDFLANTSNDTKAALAKFVQATKIQNKDKRDEAIQQFIESLPLNIDSTLAVNSEQVLRSLFSSKGQGDLNTSFTTSFLDALKTVYIKPEQTSLSPEEIQELQYLWETYPKNSVAPDTIDNVQGYEDKILELYQNYQLAIDAQEELFTELGLNIDDVNSLAEYLALTNEELQNNQYLANAVAASMLRYSAGIQDVTNNYDEWLLSLHENTDNDVARWKTLTELAVAYGNVLNINSDLLSEGFLNKQHHLDLLKQAAEGNSEAYAMLQYYAALDMGGAKTVGRTVINKLASNDDEKGTAYTDAEVDEIGTYLARLYNDTYDNLIKSGVDATAASEQVKGILEALGFVVTQGKYTNGVLTKATEFAKLAEDSGGVLEDFAEELEEIQLDEIERYKEINDQLDILADAYDDAAKAADRLYGAARIEKLKEMSGIIDKELADLEIKKGQAGTYLDTDKTNLVNALVATGLNINPKDWFNSDGTIANYETGMQTLQEWAKLSEENQEQYENIVKLISTYDGTREELQNILNQIMDKTYAKQDNAFQQMTEALNYGLEKTNDKLKNLDFTLSLLEDDFYKTAEAAAILFSANPEATDKYDLYNQSFKDYKTQYTDLITAYNNGDGTISYSAFVEGMKAVKDGLYEQIEALTSLDKSMLEYYSNTLAKGQEELSKYTDRLDHLTSALDHYKSILGILGKNKDYAVMGSVLEGIVNTSAASMKASTEAYNMYAQQVKDAQDKVTQAKEQNASEEQMKVYENELEAAQNALAQAEEQMLQDTQSWAEALKEQFRNTFEELGATLEAALLTEEGLSFDYLTTQMERATSLQEEYLTTTNKIYETTKLMRTAQQAIDASTNATVKSKLKNFITETQQLQNQTELSKYELEIQQAKYDLLLAEIALEDAQNAKSVVRLQRDAAGNFGYVYTADDSQVSDAQQKVEDAQNNLYNIALEGAENYTNKQIEAMAQYQAESQALQEAYLNGEITSQEEYQKKMQDLQNHYYEVLKNSSYLYQVATSADARVIQDSWSTSFQGMIVSADEWQQKTNDYIDKCNAAFGRFKNALDPILNEDGTLKGLETRLGEVKDETQLLSDTIGDKDKGLINALSNEYDAVKNITDAYAAQRKELVGDGKSTGLIGAVQTYLDKINKALDAAEELETKKVQPENPENDNSKGTDDTTPPSTTTSNTELTKGAKVKVLATASTWSDGDSISNWVKGSTFEVLRVYDDGTVAIGNPNGSSGGYTGTIKAADLQRFNSGGYTGEWGPGGKIAILDEKELILNQQDTANILATVESVRHILEILDLHTLNAQVGGLLSMPGHGSFGSGTLEQSVHIEATFPNVSDRNEIEEAFNNLVNKASQYANRK